MKIFISSLISGFGPYRDAAKVAVTTLRHQPVMAEDFGARPASPQLTCLQGVREADLVLLILGQGYGTVQGASGVAPTHEEYREAKGRKPVLVFVQQGVLREPAQEAFVTEVQAWEGGHFRAGFSTPGELQAAIIRALRDYELAHATAPLDLPALAKHAQGALPQTRRNGFSAGAPMLHVGVAGGPLQRLLRPSELEDHELRTRLHKEALFGGVPLFDRTKGSNSGLDGDALFLDQEKGARILLDEFGSLLLRLLLHDGNDRSGFASMILIEETVQQALSSALAFASWALDVVDQSQRLTHVAVAVRIDAGEHMAWRTRREHAASPNSMQMGFGQQEAKSTQGTWPRAALRLEGPTLAEDLLVRLRRIWKTS